MGFEPTQEQIRAESVYASWHELGKKDVPARTPLPRKPMTQAYCSSQTGAGYNAVSYKSTCKTCNDRYYQVPRSVHVNNLGKVVNSDKKMEDGGVCTVRYQKTRGAAWYNYGYRTVTTPIEYEETSEQLSRETFWINVVRGNEILKRIDAVGGAETKTELIHKELIQSPVYIAEQKRIADEKAVEEQRLLNIKLNEEKIAKLEQKLVEIEEQNELVELRKLEYERIQTQNLLESEKEIEVDEKNKKKTIGTALLIGGIGLGLFALSKRKSFK
jgi:hypothetical protein